MTIKDLLGSSSEELEEISTDFKINRNIIEFRNRIIQLSNIESISLVEPPHQKTNRFAIIFLLVGLVMLSFNIFIGIIIIGICCYYFYSIINTNNNLGKSIYINLPSGFYICIHFNDINFAQKVMSILEDYLNDKNSGIMLINVEDSNITMGDDSPIINGN